jgi:hypothetical protein
MYPNWKRGPQDYDTAIPEPYAVSIAALERRCPDHVGTADWQQATEDGRRFLRRWGQQAATIGWTARDLFGLPHIPEKPSRNYRRLSRYDETGLIWLLRGRPAIPEPYAVSIAALERRCPDHVGTADWQQAMEDGRRFLRRWGQQAATIGWTARD